MIKHKFGKVVLIGEPNVGKSSLVNKIVRGAVSVVTDIPGTTREQIRGIKTTPNYQIVFMDTPGMHAARNSLQKFMSKSISHALAEADLILYVLDATDIKEEHLNKIKNYEKTGKPLVLAINKADKTNFEKLYPTLEKVKSLSFIKETIPTSAKSGFNIDVLEQEIAKHLPTGKSVYEQDDFTTQTTRRMVEEIIRGALLELLDREIPHGIAVSINKFEERPKEIEIHADIICEKTSHRPIIIGKKGENLKAAGISARSGIQKLVGRHVKLYTHVVVREGWRDKKNMLDELGYT